MRTQDPVEPGGWLLRFGRERARNAPLALRKDVTMLQRSRRICV